MDFREVVRARRSVRDFDPAPLSREVLQRIIDGARLAPSAGNEQPWRFYVASGEKREEIGSLIACTTVHLRDYLDVLGPEGHEEAARWYSALGDAPTLIVVTSPASADAQIASERCVSLGAAVENILLAAVDEGLAACNITFSHWAAQDLVRALGVADGWNIVTVIAIGKPGTTPPKEQQRRPDDTIWLE
jgi:nitroreductase